MSDPVQKLKLIEVSDDEDETPRRFDLTKINNILAEARSRGATAEDDSDTTNTVDPMQKASLDMKVREIEHTKFLLVTKNLKITEENVSQILNLVDQCIKYLMWKGSPFSLQEKLAFLQFIELVYSTIRPSDGSENTTELSLWRKCTNHLLDGAFVIYLSEIWEQLEISIARFAPDTPSSEVWKGMKDEEKTLANLFYKIMKILVTITPDVTTPEIWKRVYDLLFTYAVKCLDSSLIAGLSTVSDPLQSHLTVALLSASCNLLSIANDDFPAQTRQQLTETISKLLSSPKKAVDLHLLALMVFSRCLSPESEENVDDDDIALLLDALLKIGDHSFIAGGVIVSSYELMETVERLASSKENMLRFLKYGKQGETDLITLVINGVQSDDAKLQTPSLGVLKMALEGELIASQLNQLKSNVKLIAVLEARRASAGAVIKQIAADVLSLMRDKNQLEELRQKLEKSSCINWTGADVRDKINECGYPLPTTINMKDCHGKWLIDLLMLRREDNQAYFNLIRSQFGIEPDKTSIEFNRSLRKLEKLILSVNTSQQPE